MTSRLYSSQTNFNQPHLQGWCGAPVVSALEGTSLREQGVGHCLTSRAAITLCLRWLKQQRCTLAVMGKSEIRVPAWVVSGKTSLSGLQAASFSLCSHGLSLVTMYEEREDSLYLFSESHQSWDFPG